MNTVHNHFELRWRDGYGPVSEAPAELARLIEELAASVASSTDHATFAVRQAEHDGGVITIGLLRLDASVSAGPRILRYLHAAALPPGYALTLRGWRALITRRYGADAEGRIRSLYEDLSTATRAAGRDSLRPLELTLADVVEVLGYPTPAGTVPALPSRSTLDRFDDPEPPLPERRLLEPAPVGGSPEPAIAPAAREPRYRSWPLVAGVAALALALGGAAGWVTRAARATTGSALAATEPTTGPVSQHDAERALAALRAQAAADLQQFRATTATLAAERRAAQVDLARALDREQAARAELAGARSELAAARSAATAQATRAAADQRALADRVAAADNDTARLTDELARAAKQQQALQQRLDAASGELARAQQAEVAQRARDDARLKQLGDVVRSLCDAAHDKPAACRETRP